ncbi:FAD-binding domain-containing protein [Lineolata rhizophorae]|uniref:ferric-chelate reductase (NADPH) n=1 Tax=Lineolata rhizophorae TaxID=578093 RepID=A0A6A6P2X7_9PEZI|nr:FAD-binding domain-containing protein [Lineolata rhizophorae]
MSGGGMSMGSMSMGGLPSNFTFQRMYWAVVGTAVGIAFVVNVAQYALFRQRIHAARRGDPTPAKPKSIPAVFFATLTALAREASHAAPPPLRLGGRRLAIAFPTVGATALVLGNAVVLVVLSLYGLDTASLRAREDVAFRAGFVSVAQLPLVFLLAGRNSVPGWLAGSSHERLNGLHRWSARCLLLTATLHMGYWVGAWAPYDYVGRKVAGDPITQRGFAAWAVLVWIALSGAGWLPLRRRWYEVFVVQHVASFVALVALVYLHTPAEVHGYIWACVAIFFFDRVLRAARFLGANLAVLHPRRRRRRSGGGGGAGALWACEAELAPLAGGATRLTVRDPPIGTWRPGQHVFLACHGVAPLQSHPFTVASLPEDGAMEFVVKAERGGTRRFFRHASGGGKQGTRSVAIEGPYGGAIRPLRQFDSVVLFAGSSGATFTVPLLRDLVSRWRKAAAARRPSPSSPPPASGSTSRLRRVLSAIDARGDDADGATVTRYVRFVWVVKSRGQLGWFAAQLSATVAEAERISRASGSDSSSSGGGGGGGVGGFQVRVHASVYVTCDETLAAEHGSLLAGLPAAAKRRRTVGEGDVRGDVDAIANAAAPVCTCSGGDATVSSGAKAAPWPSQPSAHDDDAAAAAAKQPPAATTTTTTTMADAALPPGLLVHPSIALLGGRPRVRDVVRRVLERARGESAVVVCGPAGLAADVRAAVVGLSDERAVHKGTGAQGVYLHVEGFGY